MKTFTKSQRDTLASAIQKSFNLESQDAELIADIQGNTAYASSIIETLKSAYGNMASRLDKVTNNKFTLVKFNKVKAERGSEKYAEQCTNIGSEFGLSGNTIQWIDTMRKALDNDQAWQNVCKWSLGYAGKSKPSNPEHEAYGKEKEKPEAPSAEEIHTKVLKTLLSQYQHLGKFEAIDESLTQLMNDIAQVLIVHGVDIEKEKV